MLVVTAGVEAGVTGGEEKAEGRRGEMSKSSRKGGGGLWLVEELR